MIPAVRGRRKGAEKTNEGRQGPAPVTPAGTPRARRGFLVKNSPVQSSPSKQSLEEAVHRDWLNDCDKASNGR